MNKKRNKLEIIRDLLTVVNEKRNATITSLIYKANLSNNSIKPYLEYLLRNNLVLKEENDRKKIFKITEKGNEFLNEFKKIKIFSEAYGLDSL